MAGIPNRVAYNFKGFSGWITHPLKINFPQPYPAYFRDIVAQLAGIKPDWSLRPLIYPDMYDETEAEDRWQEYELGKGRPVIACFMTTRQPNGFWPSDNFGRALALIKKQTGASIAVCGAAEDRQLLERVEKGFSLQSAILAGDLGLRALYCFLKKTTAVFTTDSGPRHIANAAGVPVCFLRNVWFNRIESGVYVDTETDLSPVDQYVPPERQSVIFAKITPEEVAKRVVAALSLG
jgi:ADP-heptose:LPS heptosyltransferase